MGKKTTIAMMYDFDKTLTTKDQQEFTFIPKILQMESKEFWGASNKLAKDYKMDGILAYMYYMLTEATHKRKKITRGSFEEYGRELEYFSGVEEWFQRINEHCEGLDVQVEHYIISSGLREIIDGSVIRPRFKDVFACEFFYDANDVAVWPKNVVNYTTKTQFIFRINKGVLDISDDASLNGYTPQDDRPIPFRNMIYIGDGMTDVPCMRLVRTNGGYSIAVYTEKSNVQELIRHERVNFIAKADYSPGGELDELVKDILIKISMEDKLADLTRRQRKEAEER